MYHIPIECDDFLCYCQKYEIQRTFLGNVNSAACFISDYVFQDLKIPLVSYQIDFTTAIKSNLILLA